MTSATERPAGQLPAEPPPEPEQPELEEQPEPPPPPPPVRYTTQVDFEAPVLTAEGFAVTIRVKNARWDGPDATATLAVALSESLQKKGLKPAPVAAVAAPAAGVAGTSDKPVAIPGEGGAPPRCSLHGPMQWREGTAKSGPNAGKPYAFYGCQTRECKLTWHPSRN